MPIVSVPGIGNVEFPDGTDEATMSRAIKGALARKKELSAPKYNPTEDMSTGERLLAGVGRGFSNIGRNVANITGFKSDDELKQSQELDAPLMATGAGKVGSFLGETAALTPLTLGLGAAATGLRAGSMGARALTNPISRGAIEGATQGFISAGPDNRRTGAVVGGAAGTILPLVGGSISKAAHGLKRTPEAQMLLDEGVSLTPGQMNPKGMFNHAEEALQSTPIVGSIIRNARESAEDQFRRSVIQRAAPGSIPKSGTAQELLESAYEGFEPLYAQAKGFPVSAAIVNNGADTSLQKAVNSAVKKPSIFADDATRTKVARFVNNQFTAMKGQLQSDDLLRVRSNIRTAARSADGAERDLLKEAEKQITKALDSQLPKQATGALSKADNQYGLYKIVESAIAKGRDRPGGFTPTMLSQAIKESTDQGVFARGGGRLRDLSQAGARTFEVRSPPTGARLGILGALGGASYVNPAVGLPVAGGIFGLAGTQGGRRLAAGQTAVQKALAKQIERATGATPAQARELAAVYSRGLLTATAVNE